MINFAIKDTEFEELAQHLEGPTAIAVCKDDATAAARVLYKFAKNAEALEVKGGIVDGAYFFPSYLDLCSQLLQTSLVLSSRLLRKTKKQHRI